MVDYSKWDNLDVSSDDDHDPYSGGGSDPSDDDDWQLAAADGGTGLVVAEVRHLADDADGAAPARRLPPRGCR